MLGCRASRFRWPANETCHGYLSSFDPFSAGVTDSGPGYMYPDDQAERLCCSTSRIVMHEQ